jgi:hypothetical protein
MYSKAPLKKAAKGSVQVTVNHDRLQLRFRVQGGCESDNGGIG